MNDTLKPDNREEPNAKSSRTDQANNHYPEQALRIIYRRRADMLGYGIRELPSRQRIYGAGAGCRVILDIDSCEIVRSRNGLDLDGSCFGNDRCRDHPLWGFRRFWRHD